MHRAETTLPEPELERLEDEIITLCGHINAAEYQFLKLLTDYDRAGMAWRAAFSGSTGSTASAPSRRASAYAPPMHSSTCR